MVEDTTWQVLPTATGFAARQAIAVLRKHNIEVAPLLRRAGLSERDFDNSGTDSGHVIWVISLGLR